MRIRPKAIGTEDMPTDRLVNPWATPGAIAEDPEGQPARGPGLDVPSLLRSGDGTITDPSPAFPNLCQHGKHEPPERVTRRGVTGGLLGGAVRGLGIHKGHRDAL